MCGIVGIYNMPRASGIFPTMLERIAHRGPDAAATRGVEGPGFDVKLGHRRLSIIDLSDAANQPFVKDGHSLVYNGEIYNYNELRQELSALGSTFRTQSDTEVLLEAWRQWGSASLNRLRGMFAFALLNETTGELIIARDPFGIKPLHYAVRGNGLVFGSELKAILPALDNTEMEPIGLLSSLVFGWLPDAYCMWRDVKKLPAGHWASFKPSGRFDLHEYYNVSVEAANACKNFISDDDLADVIEDSVRAHMVADVPVSTFLSGGLDSSLITVLAKRFAGSLDSYTISFRAEDMKLEAMPDDLKYARLVANKFDIRLHEIEITSDIVRDLPRLVDVLDEPIGDAAALNTILICSAARKAGVKVLLSGMGADEMFGGYRKHQAALMSARYRSLPSFIRKAVIEPAVDALPVALFGRGIRPVRFAKRFLTFSNLPEEASFRRSYSFIGESEVDKFVRPDLAPMMRELFDYHSSIYAQGSKMDVVNRMCFTDVRLFMEALNLTYTDRASMSASTEVRVPFIDREVMSAAYAIPGSRKIVGNERKAALKNAAIRTLPKEIVYRPKALFSAPLRAWIRRDLRDQLNELVANGKLVNSGWLDKKYVSEMIAADRAGTSDYSRELWQLLTTESWLRHNNVSPN